VQVHALKVAGALRTCGDHGFIFGLFTSLTFSANEEDLDADEKSYDPLPSGLCMSFMGLLLALAIGLGLYGMSIINDSMREASQNAIPAIDALGNAEIYIGRSRFVCDRVALQPSSQENAGLQKQAGELLDQSDDWFKRYDIFPATRRRIGGTARHAMRVPNSGRLSLTSGRQSEITTRARSTAFLSLPCRRPMT
jgi:hypothetical protein